MAFTPSPKVVQCGQPGDVKPACTSPSGEHKCGVNVRFMNGQKLPHNGVHECDHCMAVW